jgi:uncharacterized protein
MSESHPSKVFMFDGDDPEMEQAKREARRTFGYFWRELAWERRRIVPALDMAAVKAPFVDGPPSPQQADHPQVEEMWLSEVDFDGQAVSGELLNSPNWLKSVTQGDQVRVPGGKISDWMYVIEGQVYGAHTVQVLRSRMGRGERAEHDQAWGLDFGDPSKVRLLPVAKAGGGVLKGWFSKREHDTAALEGDHPMSINMAPSLREQIAKDPSFITSKDERGWTILHHLALAGSLACVKVVLEAGADAKAKTAKGFTAAQLAKVLGWNEVVALLEGGNP